MTTPHRTRFVLAQTALLLVTAFILSVTGVFAYGLFVLLSVLGFIVVTDLLTLSHVRPRWYGRLRAFVVAGLVTATLVIGFRFLQLFAPEMIP